MNDIKIKKLINLEEIRENEFMELIASENFVSDDVREAVGSVLTNKYAEGYPFARYYAGTEFVDQIEEIAIERIKKLFNANFANVQPHSGSQANAAVFLALLKPGDKIMGMSLTSGGHLTHGYKVSSSGKYYDSVSYDVNKQTNLLDYDEIMEIAIREKPNLIIAGASAYSRKIDFEKFRIIADKVGAYLMADVAHISGLIVTNHHQNPIEFAHVVTSTTHKTLRGARGGIILTNDVEISKKVNSAVFPGLQGGPLMHVIAGKAIAFYEASDPSFNEYIINVMKNAKDMSSKFIDLGAKIITGGTDNHLFLLDVETSYGISGQRAETLLQMANIIVNKNTIPFDDKGPVITSGIRIGTPAMTTKGITNSQFIEITIIIDDILRKNNTANAEGYSTLIKEMISNV
jgi:glycine hydroxymethyltransferase